MTGRKEELTKESNIMRVAILDDDILYGQVLKQYLKKVCNMHIDVFHNEANFLHKSECYDCLILDHFLEESEGMMVLRKYKHADKLKKIFYISSFPKLTGTPKLKLMFDSNPKKEHKINFVLKSKLNSDFFQQQLVINPLLG